MVKRQDQVLETQGQGGNPRIAIIMQAWRALCRITTLRASGVRTVMAASSFPPHMGFKETFR
jgi:hypothetical protein